mgnify:CR=1 FL=1
MSCTYCPADTPPGLYLCARDVERLASLLDRAPALLATARETVEKQGGQTGAGGGNASVASAPINLDALERVDEFERALCSQSALVSEVDASLRAKHAARSSWVGPKLAELLDLEERLIAIIDRPIDWLRLTACQWPTTNGQLCPGHYRYQAGQVLAECGRCHSTMDVAEHKRWRMRQAQHHPAPLRQVVEALAGVGFPVTLDAAKTLVKRGKLVPVETEEGRRYTADAVLTAFDQTPTGRRLAA